MSSSYIVITNTSGKNLSLSATDRSPAISMLPSATANIPINDVQFDVAFIDGLINLLNDSNITLTLGTRVLTVADLEDLKHTDVSEIEAGISSVISPMGDITIASDFPLLAEVVTGWMYHILADVQDSDATKTHTTQSFLAGAEIVWNGTNWTELGENVTTTLIAAAGAFVLPAGNSVSFVATTAGATETTLPAATAVRRGEIISIGDYTSHAATNNITIHRNAANIDGAASDLVLNKDGIFVSLQCLGTAGWKTIARIAPVAEAATPLAVGAAAAGTSLICSPDDHVHAHGNQLGGTLHADATISVAGFMTGADKTKLDDMVRGSLAAGISVTAVAPIDGTLALSGLATKNFCPERLVITLVSADGVLNGNAHITLGTGAPGAVDILPDTTLTNLIAVGSTFAIDLNDLFPAIPGNSTLHLRVITADTAGVGITSVIMARIEGTEA